jgi:hypothetical protein
MTEREEKELRNYCAFMLKEYGFDFAPTDPVVPALYVMHREIQVNRKSNDTVSAEIKEAVTKMNSKVFHFNSPGEAWRFQIAGSLKWLFLGLSVNLLLWIALKWWSAKNDLDEAQRIIRSSGRINAHLLNNVKEDRDGFMFLEFTEAKESSIKNFIEYEKVNSKTVRVYLGLEK